MVSARWLLVEVADCTPDLVAQSLQWCYVHERLIVTVEGDPKSQLLEGQVAGRASVVSHQPLRIQEQSVEQEPRLLLQLLACARRLVE